MAITRLETEFLNFRISKKKISRPAEGMKRNPRLKSRQQALVGPYFAWVRGPTLQEISSSDSHLSRESIFSLPMKLTGQSHTRF
jgi:hypothetical protein